MTDSITLTPDQITTLLDHYGWVIGPRFDPGWGNERPRTGWFVFPDWVTADSSTYNLDGSEGCIGQGDTLAEAFMEALQTIGGTL